jgi:GWxTD domain-containing protein
LRNKLRSLVILLPFLALGISGAVPASAADRTDLPPVYKDWLALVDPIMTSAERDVFKALTKDPDRDKFIQIFWKQHDTYPDTPENEFQKEYMARVAFADGNFRGGSNKKGHLSERGRYYLLLGPPLERQRYTTYSEIWPMELWYYKGEEEYGLPPYFYLIFYQPQGMGDYRLYYPGVDGANALTVPALYGERRIKTTPVDTIKKVSPELANAAINYVAGDGDTGAYSMSSAAMLANVNNLKEKKYADTYARSFLNFKDFVETDYTDRFVPSAFKVRIFRTNGQNYLHWTLEPEKVGFDLRAGVYTAQFELFLTLEDPAGNLVYQADDEIPIRLNEAQYKGHERRRFALQDVLPVIEGTFKISLLLKNKTGRDFTSVDKTVTVPAESGPRFGDLLLSHGQTPAPEAERGRLKAFVFDGVQYAYSAREEFAPGETMVCYLQGAGLSEMSGHTLAFEIVGLDGEPVAADRKPLGDVLGPDGELATSSRFDLAAVAPGYYEIRASLSDADGRTVYSLKEPFILLAQAAVVVPWSLARVRNVFPDPDGLAILGSQRLRTRDYERAIPLFEQALALKDKAATRVLYAKALLAANRTQDAIAAATPVYAASGDRDAGKTIASGLVARKDWEGALVYLDKLLEGAIEVEVLNLAAECHLELGRPQVAISLLERSLGMDSGQPAARALLERARKGA